MDAVGAAVPGCTGGSRTQSDGRGRSIRSRSYRHQRDRPAGHAFARDGPIRIGDPVSRPGRRDAIDAHWRVRRLYRPGARRRVGARPRLRAGWLHRARRDLPARRQAGSQDTWRAQERQDLSHPTGFGRRLHGARHAQRIGPVAEDLPAGDVSPDVRRGPVCDRYRPGRRNRRQARRCRELDQAEQFEGDGRAVLALGAWRHVGRRQENARRCDARPDRELVTQPGRNDFRHRPGSVQIRRGELQVCFSPGQLDAVAASGSNDRHCC